MAFVFPPNVTKELCGLKKNARRSGRLRNRIKIIISGLLVGFTMAEQFFSPILGQQSISQYAQSRRYILRAKTKTLMERIIIPNGYHLLLHIEFPSFDYVVVSKMFLSSLDQRREACITVCRLECAIGTSKYDLNHECSSINFQIV